MPTNRIRFDINNIDRMKVTTLVSYQTVYLIKLYSADFRYTELIVGNISKERPSERWLNGLCSYNTLKTI